MKIILSLLLWSFFANANIQPVTLNFPDKIIQSRWIIDKNTAAVAPLYRKLADFKKAQFEGQWEVCSSLGSQLLNSQKSLKPWILVVLIECDNKLFETKKKVQPLRNHILTISKNKDYLLKGPYSQKLKKLYVKSQFGVLEWEIKNRPQNAWLKLGDLLDLQDWMSKEEKAKSYKLAGELAFLQQNLTTAKAYVLRSLSEIEDPKLREKLNSIEALISSKESSSKQIQDAAVTAVLLGEEKQQATVERMTMALKSGELLSAIKDGIELIEDYPGSVHADWAAQRILESYLSVANLDEKKYRVLRFDFIDEMKDADSKRLSEWGTRIYKLGQYRDATSLLLEAYSKLKSSYVPVEVIDLLAKSYLHTKEYSNALKIFKEIALKYSGSKEAAEAHLNIGLIEYLNKNYEKAEGYFEKVIAQTQFPDFELSARYWLWRSAQKTDSARAQVEVQILIDNFPFSYYGLRAVSDLNSGVIDFSSLDKKVNKKFTLWLTQDEKASWDRLQILIAAGWFEEAKLELEQLPIPSTPEGQMLLARYYAASLNYPTAIRMFNKAWDENSEFRALPIVQLAFPKEFFSLIEKSANEKKLDPFLTLSLIRQESSFAPKAESTSGALGLMQLIPPTAQEVAQSLKLKNFSIPESLYEPELNIKMGTHYYAQMLSQFQNNVPLALAAYNAGPTRLKRWIESSQFEAQSSSSPEYEIWMDLLPWSETRFYVKAILRNYLIYKLLESKKIQVQDPVWLSQKK